jgi:hypothetical protein
MSKWMCLLVSLLSSFQANAAVLEKPLAAKKSNSIDQQTTVRTSMVLRVMSRTEIIDPNGGRSTTMVPFHPVNQSIRFPAAGESELFIGSWKVTLMPSNGIFNQGNASFAMRLQRELEAGSDSYADLGMHSFTARIWGATADRNHWTMVSFDSRRFESEEQGLIVDVSFGDSEERSLLSKRLGLNVENTEKIGSRP